MRFIFGTICILASGASATTLAYVDAKGTLVYQAEGSRPGIADAHGYEPSLRRDGKQLVYTRQTSDKGPNTLALYDAATSRSRDLVTGYVTQPLWSPDGTRIRFLRYDTKRELWVMDPSQPSKASPLRP